MTTNEDRVTRLRAHIEGGTLLRNEWGDGHERACLLTALAPEVVEVGEEGIDITACPAAVMPAWLAHLTPSMDDRGTSMAWLAMVRRYAELAGRWHVLDDEAWDRAKYGAALALLRLALECADGDEGVSSAITSVIAWFEAGRATEDRVRVCATAYRAVEAAHALCPAGETVFCRMQRRSLRSAAVARLAVVCVDDSGGVLRMASALTEGAPHMVLWDRVNDAVLDVVEAEIEAANG